MLLHRRNIRQALLGATALAGAASLGISSPALAQSRQVQFDIAPQSLSSALREYGASAEQQLIYSEADVRRFTAPALRGAYTPDEGLAMLLAGTDLTVERTPAGILRIVGDADPQSGSAAGDGAEGTVEALIVTAQKREEDIQDVPIAISAFTQEALETHQIAGGPDLITQVPNMTFTKTNFSSYSIQLRGIGTQAISATTDPGVAVAFNNTPFIQNRFFEQEFYDLQRVEVLRGPQGTLYGRNATAGVVNIISAKPKFVAEAKLSGDIANYNTTRVEGMINIPLVEDMVALRLAGAWTKRDGYATNEITGNPIDGRDLWSTRLSLRFAPTDNIDANLIWEHFEEDDDRLRSGKQLCKKHVVTQVGNTPVTHFEQLLRTGGLHAIWVAVQPRFSTGCERESLYSDESFQTPNGASLQYHIPIGVIGGLPSIFDAYASQVQSRDLRVIESTVDPVYRAKADLGELQISWDVTDDLTLASETAYSADVVWSKQDFNRFNTASHAFCAREIFLYSPDMCIGEAQPNGPVARGVLSEDGVFCDPQVGCADRLVAVDLSTAKSRQFNQEFRLSSDFDGPLNFSLGANFTRFDLEAKYYVFINSLTLTAINAQYSLQNPYDPENPVVTGYRCGVRGPLLGDPAGFYGPGCMFVEPYSIEDIQDQGHNYFLSKNPYRLMSYAVFGEAYYDITDNLKITGGLRWTVDQKHAPRVPSWIVVGTTRGYPVSEVTKQEWREPTGRLAIDWKPDLAFTDETMVYASYAHGYKAGGSNPPPFVAIYDPRGGEAGSATRPKTFDAEFVDAYELGSKNTLLDGKVTLNLAAFYYDYTGYQISEIVDRSAYNQNYDAEVWGVEIEADWRPFENLKLGFKGGYENTRIADGEQAIDLMDRTAGNPDWITIRPFAAVPSNCILPVALFTHNGVIHNPETGEDYVLSNPTLQENSIIDDLAEPGSNAEGTACEYAYRAGHDPVTNLPYVAYPTSSGQSATLIFWPTGEGTPGAYPGFNPDWAPNNGEGFFKDLGGNPLPNAPNFTATITADYTVPLPNDWLATLHTDLYWQSESNWRIFDDHEFNKLDEYFTMNVAAIFNNEEAGWRVMAYVKNVFDRDSITGAFLNSDDTGLTTNVFLTEPRLYGLRVSKSWTGGPLLGGFGLRREGPYPFSVEIGGQVQRHEAPNDPIAPSFMDQFLPELDQSANQQEDLDWGDGREVKLTWQPNSDWKVALGARIGKTNGSVPWAERKHFIPADYNAGETYDVYDYTISTTTDREEHTLIDFTVGRDVGIGGLSASTVSAGLRHAQLESATDAHIFGQTNWDMGGFIKYGYYDFAFFPTIHDRYEARIRADREFKGTGPVLSWEASKTLLGGRESGTLDLDWSVSGGVLFGKRNTSITGDEVAEYFYVDKYDDTGIRELPDTVTTTPVRYNRSESVTVPTFGATLGLSYKVDRFSIGAGYRWERYQDAIDGGYAESKEEDRTIDGPYFKLSVGFGG